MEPSPSSFNGLRAEFQQRLEIRERRFACVPNDYLLVYRTGSRLSRCFALLWSRSLSAASRNYRLEVGRIFLSAFADNSCELLNWTLPLQDFLTRFPGFPIGRRKKTSTLHRFRCMFCCPSRAVLMESNTYL